MRAYGLQDLLEQLGIGGNDIAPLQVIVPADEVTAKAAGFLYQQDTRRHVPDVKPDFPEAVQSPGSNIGQVQAGGTGAPDAGGLGVP
jgi:hypothetical protein